MIHKTVSITVPITNPASVSQECSHGMATSCGSNISVITYMTHGLRHISKDKYGPLTVLTGKRGSDVAEGEEGVGGFSSLLAMACCSCSNLGPRRYLSRHNLTVCPVLLNTSTAWWFV